MSGPVPLPTKFDKAIINLWEVLLRIKPWRLFVRDVRGPLCFQFCP